MPLAALGRHVPVMVLRARKVVSEVVGKNIDKLLDQINRGGEAQVRNRVIMNLAIIGNGKMSTNRFSVDFNLIRCFDDDPVTVVFSLSNRL